MSNQNCNQEEESRILVLFINIHSKSLWEEREEGKGEKQRTQKDHRCLTLRHDVSVEIVVNFTVQLCFIGKY